MKLTTKPKPKKKQKVAAPRAVKPLIYQQATIDEHVAGYRKNRQRLEASDMGAGKTFIACFTAKAMGKKLAVIAPKPAIKTWETTTKLIGVEVLFITNYEALTVGTKHGWGSSPVRQKMLAEYAERVLLWETHVDLWKKENPNATGDQLKLKNSTKPKRPMCEDNTWIWDDSLAKRDDVLVVVDECHRAGGETSLASELVIALKRQNLYAMAISASYAISPAMMRALGYFVHMHTLGDFHMWAVHHGCIKNRFGQLQFVGGDESLRQLHAEMFPSRGCRIRIADLPKGQFPETQISADVYDTGATKKINAIYDEMQRELDRWAAGMSTTKGMNPLTLMLRARQKAELEKVPTFIDMIKDARADGMSVLCFVNFRETLWAIAERLKLNALYYGGNKGEREKWLQRFQDNEEDTLLLNIAAGAESISCHDIHGNHPRYSIISPTWSAIKLSQCFGRPHRAGGKTPSLQRVVYAAGTIEERVCQRVQEKLRNMSAMLDGDLMPDHLLEFLAPYAHLLKQASEIATQEE